MDEIAGWHEARFAMAAELHARNWPRVTRFDLFRYPGDNCVFVAAAELETGDEVQITFCVPVDIYPKDHTSLRLLEQSFARTSLGASHWDYAR